MIIRFKKYPHEGSPGYEESEMGPFEFVHVPYLSLMDPDANILAEWQDGYWHTDPLEPAGGGPLRTEWTDFEIIPDTK